MTAERPEWAQIKEQVVLRAKKGDKIRDLVVTIVDASEEAVLLERRTRGVDDDRLEFLYDTATGSIRETTKGMKPWSFGEVTLLAPSSGESDLIRWTDSFQQDLRTLNWSVDDLREGPITKEKIHEFLAHLALGLASGNHLLTLIEEDDR